MSLLDSLAHHLMDNEALKFAPVGIANPLSPAERWTVTLSAPLMAFQGGWIDAMETGEDPDTLRRGVAEMWGVDSPASFRETADWLVARGHRNVYAPLWQCLAAVQKRRRAAPLALRLLLNMTYPAWFVQQVSRQHDLATLSAAAGLALPAAYHLLMEADDLLETLAAHFGVSPQHTPNLVAWDAVRLAALSRWAVQLGYLGRESFTAVVQPLAEAAAEAYGSWRELSGAYLAAGFIWNSSDSRVDNLVRTNRLLIDDARSPYRTVTWR